MTGHEIQTRARNSFKKSIFVTYLPTLSLCDFCFYLLTRLYVDLPLLFSLLIAALERRMFLTKSFQPSRYSTHTQFLLLIPHKNVQVPNNGSGFTFVFLLILSSWAVLTLSSLIISVNETSSSRKLTTKPKGRFLSQRSRNNITCFRWWRQGNELGSEVKCTGWLRPLWIPKFGSCFNPRFWADKMVFLPLKTAPRNHGHSSNDGREFFQCHFEQQATIAEIPMKSSLPSFNGRQCRWRFDWIRRQMG